MKKEIKRIGPLKFGFYMMIIGTILSLIYIPAQYILESGVKTQVETLSGPISVAGDPIQAPSVLSFIIISILVILIFGFLSGVLSALTYNFLAKKIGGIKIDLVDLPDTDSVKGKE